MDLPIKFPDDADVIAEEAARFRALSPAERLRAIRGIIATGELIIRRSPKAEFLRAYKLEQEKLARETIKEFIARHGG
jgi:hypothetical protein